MSSLMKYVNAENIVRDTLELVSIASVTGNTTDVAARYEQLLRAERCDVTRYEFLPNNPTLVAVFESPAYSSGSSSAKTILLNGHMDVIPLPHTPAKLENGRVYGRGACDMKGSLACALEVVRIVREHGAALPVKIVIVANSLHESPGGRGEDLIALTENVTLQADAGIVMEGATRECTIAQLGSATFNIIVRRDGEASHQILTPPGTPHPMMAAVDVIQGLDRLNKELENHYIEDIGYGSYFIGSVQCGKFYNQFPTTAELVGIRRYGPSEELADIDAEFRGLLAAIAEQHGVHIELDLEKVRDGYRLDKTSPIVAAFVAAIKEARGIDAPLVGKKVVTDAGILARALGVPILCHGPDAATAHGDVEYVETEELKLATKTYIQFIEKLVAEG